MIPPSNIALQQWVDRTGSDYFFLPVLKKKSDYFLFDFHWGLGWKEFNCKVELRKI